MFKSISLMEGSYLLLVFLLCEAPSISGSICFSLGLISQLSRPSLIKGYELNNWRESRSDNLRLSLW